MSATIYWNTLTPQQWRQKFMELPRSNLLQSHAYAQSVCPLLRQRARWGVIELNGREAGLVQLQEAGIFGNALHALILDRGPLWYDGFGGPDDYGQFIKALLQKYPRRIGRKYRIIPEINYSEQIKSVMQRAGFSEIGKPYETIWLDLTKSGEELRGQMKKNWRGSLIKAEKEKNLEIEWDLTTAHFKEFLENYTLDKAAKGYDGPTVELLMALAKNFVPQGNMMLGRAVKHRKVVASILLLKHGRSATYQIGWTSNEGRDLGAQNQLLWHAILVLQKQGITGLDLGGINDETAKGVQKFKQGLGGTVLRLGAIYS